MPYGEAGVHRLALASGGENAGYEKLGPLVEATEPTSHGDCSFGGEDYVDVTKRGGY